ncbi:MAG: hypothetical protein RLZ55_961 [Actinomycetota bacterium]
MSGGVDSAVAAARAKDAGHDVTGVHFALSSDPAAQREGARGCCTLSDARDARRAADAIGIPFYVWDLAEQFADQVVADFLAEYEAGRTPNPCVRCNERIKFATVLDRGVALGFDAVCTGHYARVSGADESPELRRAMDQAKDQSYVIAVVGLEQLRRVLLPLGGSTKADVRREASDRGLAVAAKPDSHDICFIPDGDTRGFLAGRLGQREGRLIDAASGDVLGTHSGSYGFTIGQRRGLGLDRPAPDGGPRYVVDIDAASNTVMLGSPALLTARHLRAERVTWHVAPWPGWRGGLTVQVRAHGTPVPASVRASADELHIDVPDGVRAAAPGQPVVVYEGDRVLASATMLRSGPGPDPAAGAASAGSARA